MCALRPSRVPDSAALFPPLLEALLALLRTLSPIDWDEPTIAGSWRVRDVAAHLLDGDLRTLSAHRDGHSLDDAPVATSYADVIALIQRLNAGGVAFARRLSPRLITDLLAVTGRWMSEFVASLDPDADALFSVAWAGEDRSDNRFDTAREYTERWHHQMQIRMAVGARGDPDMLLARELSAPLLQTAVRVLPHAYRDVDAEPGTTLVIRAPERTASSNRGHELAWTLRRESDRWRLYDGEPDSEPTARVIGSVDALWRLFFHALPEEEAPRVLAATGVESLLRPLWSARSLMV